MSHIIRNKLPALLSAKLICQAAQPYLTLEEATARVRAANPGLEDAERAERPEPREPFLVASTPAESNSFDVDAALANLKAKHAEQRRLAPWMSDAEAWRRVFRDYAAVSASSDERGYL